MAACSGFVTDEGEGEVDGDGDATTETDGVAAGLGDGVDPAQEASANAVAETAISLSDTAMASCA